MYAQIIQFANHVASAARTMGVTLAELPALAEATADLPKKQAGALVRGVVDGPGGLVETADHVAEMADDLLSRLGDSGRKEAFASFRDIGGELQRQANAVAPTKAENLAVLQAEAESAGRRIRANLDKLELQAALVGVAAVMENLAAALKSMASAWRQAGQSMTKAMSAVDAGQLSDPAYLKKALNLDVAVREWNGLADATRSFVQGSVTAI